MVRNARHALCASLILSVALSAAAVDLSQLRETTSDLLGIDTGLARSHCEYRANNEDRNTRVTSQGRFPPPS